MYWAVHAYIRISGTLTQWGGGRRVAVLDCQQPMDSADVLDLLTSNIGVRQLYYNCMISAGSSCTCAPLCCVAAEPLAPWGCR
jgi:hypothetical protein